MTAWCLGVRLTCQNLDRTTGHQLTNIGKRCSCCEHGKSQTNGLETGALFFFSACLVIRARLVFCAKCSIHLAWLIKRLFCRLLLDWAGYLSISSLKPTLQLQNIFGVWLFEKAWEISCQQVRAWETWNCETHNKVVRLGMPICIKYTGFLIFCVVTEPQNSSKSAKFTKTWKIPPNSVEILSNTCLYNTFETHFSLWGYLNAVNLQIMYITTSSLHLCTSRANKVPKLPGIEHVAKNWALAMMLKALPLVHFWSVLLLKEQMMTSDRKMLKTLVWSAQNRSISIEICLENNHKISHFLPEIPMKFPRNWPNFLRICP